MLDTTTRTRYEKEIKKDTVIKWYDKIKWKQSPPEKIYYQKVDSVFQEKIKYKDLMLKVDKHGEDLKIFAINENDSIIKEYYFKVNDDFIATSIISHSPDSCHSRESGNPGKPGIFVKSSFWNLNLLKFSLSHSRDFEQYDKLRNGDITVSYAPELKIGRNFTISPSIGYKFSTGSKSKPISELKFSISF